MPSLTLDRHSNGIAIATFDLPDSKVNLLSKGLIGEFSAILDSIDQDDSITAIVLRSGKPDGFIAGANLDDIVAMTSIEEARDLVRNAHTLIDRIASSRKPFVAAIHGPALGGGLEIALACHVRVASDDPKTVLALPEVMLGLLPGAGGTQRLPATVGLLTALPMLLQGRRVRPLEAKAIGLIHAIATPADLMQVAMRIASESTAGTHATRPSLGMFQRLMNDFGPVRSLILRKAKQSVLQKTRGLYPAPLCILECVETGLSRGFRAGQQREISAFGDLVLSPEARNLIWLFRESTATRKPRGADSRPAAVVGVIGAGLMGTGIASVSVPFAETILTDVSQPALDAARRTVDGSLAKRVAGGSLSITESEVQQRHLTLSTGMKSLSRAGLVIEAVFEDLALKRNVLAKIDGIVTSDCVFASNTSALPIAAIAEGSQHPERVLGMHYFSPVPKMPLLEIVVTPVTSQRAIDMALACGVAQGKIPIVVRDGPGFYTTRILAPYINEAVTLLEEGAGIHALDSALKNFGFPVGPIALLDEVGIDVANHVSHDLGRAFAHRGLQPSASLSRIAEAGLRGRKSGKGFYLYPNRGRKTVNSAIYRFTGGRERKSMPAADLVDRLSLLMINEAVHCLAEGVISSPRDGDIGAMLGLGFPPFRGGPFHHVDAVGASVISRRLEELAAKHGPRFAPAPLLMEKAAGGSRFYG